MSCIDCKYCRKALCKDKNKVACGYISGVRHGLFPFPYIPDEDDYLPTKVRYSNFEQFLDDIIFINGNTIYEGWANLRIKPHQETKGLITNYCIIVDSDNCCNYYECEKK